MPEHEHAGGRTFEGRQLQIVWCRVWALLARAHIGHEQLSQGTHEGEANPDQVLAQHNSADDLVPRVLSRGPLRFGLAKPGTTLT
jgi:hypothetical protein